MTVTYLAAIAPQRSTQYSALATTLAPHELMLSALGKEILRMEAVELAGAEYLHFMREAELDTHLLGELGMLATLRGLFRLFEDVPNLPSPLLHPISLPFEPRFSPDLVATRRYSGKTNELFTHFLCNLARASSDFAHLPWRELRLFDPLAGGGTTLLTGLMLGAEVMGVERNEADIHSTATFLDQYAREQRIACSVKEERLKKVGKRWTVRLGKEEPGRAVLAAGDTAISDKLLLGIPRPHLLVADLPYGIQHQGPLLELLNAALPVWKTLLQPGGVMVLAWESTRFARAQMIDAVARERGLHVLNDPPYNQLAHRVDRVIKQRDVIVLQKVRAQ